MSNLVAEPRFYEKALEATPVRQRRGRLPIVGFVQTWSEHIWYRTIVSVMQARATQYGATLLIEDTTNVAEQLKAIARLLNSKVDVLIVVPAAEQGYESAVAMASQRKVPIITESDPLPGAMSLVSIDDYASGCKLGSRIGELWASQNEAAPCALDIGMPTFASCRNRSDGFLVGLREASPEAQWTNRVNGRAQVEWSQGRATEAFAAHPEINLVFGIDDESAYGGLRAWQKLGRPESSLWVATFGSAGDEEKRRLLESPAYRAGLLMFPEHVAIACFDAAVAAADGESLPKRIIAPTAAADGGELAKYYRATGSHWLPDFRAIASIPVEPVEESIS